MIPVTKPYIPSVEKYQKYVAQIFENQWFTNNGTFVREFEARLRDKLEMEELLFVGNGTIALQIAIKALHLRGEIITTPFSYVATTSSIVWEGCTPVFADIDPDTFNIDPDRIIGCITENTSAILATHCFGNACDIDKIQAIADHYKLKVIYDGAHCFGTSYKGKSIFAFGDISTTSLHATKLIHSVEGGVIFSNKKNISVKASFMRNFGHNGPEKFSGVGINGKNSELHAAMGILVLDDFDHIIQNRKNQYDHYIENLDQNNLKFITVQKHCGFNHAYFPVVFDSYEKMHHAKLQLEKANIFPRRYFSPSLDTLDYVSNSTTCKNSKSIAARILCLPLFHSLTVEEQDEIILIINKSLRNA